MLNRGIFSCLFFLFSLSIFGQTIPLDLYHTLKKLHYRPTESILVVSIAHQRLYLFKDGKLFKSYIVSTAKNGVGEQEGSEKTPLGLHLIASMYGKDAPLYTIFRSRMNTKKIYKAGTYSNEDLVLTRILCLDGLEEGVNQGKNAKGELVDSFKRYIYIHGTNHEEDLGKPLSKGCIRMNSCDIVELFDLVKEGSLVWIYNTQDSES